MARANPVPDGYHTLTPYLIVASGAKAMAFYEQAFGAVTRMKTVGPNGEIFHSEMQLGDSLFGVSDEMPSYGLHAPSPEGGNSTTMMVYTPEVDALWARALAAGAKELSPLADQFHGDRMGTLRCPFGHRWIFAMRLEDLGEAEIQRRTDEWLASLPKE